MPRGDGYFRRRGKSLYWEFMWKGKRYTIRLGNITKSEARHIVAKIKAKIISGEWGGEVDGAPYMKEILSAYHKWYESHTRARERSKEVHLYRIELLKKYFGSLRADEVSWLTVENYKSKRLKDGVGKATINRELTVLRAVFNRAKELGIYEGDVPKIEFFKEEEEDRLRYLSPEEAHKLIEACPEWFRAVVIFALNTGLRAGEIFSLRWENVDFDGETIRIESEGTKTKSVYTVPMNETVKELLLKIKEEHRERGIEHGFVFTNRYGLPYKYEDKTYRKVFTTACKRAGIKDFRFHDLRHTFASWVAMKSKDIYAVQKLLNHKRAETTRRYAHLTEEYLKKVINSISDFGTFSSDKKSKSV